MKAFRKASLFIVVVLVLVLVLAACNRDSDNNNVTPTPQPGGTDVAPPPPPAPIDVPTGADDAYLGVVDDGPVRAGLHEPKDLGGRTILVGSWWDGTIPFSLYGWDEPDPATSDNYFLHRMMWDNAQRVYSEFNFNLQEVIIDYGYVLETLTASVMAGDAFADIVLLSGSMQLMAITGDLIQSLDDINLPNSDVLGPQIYGRVFTEAFGNRWSFWDNRPESNGQFLGVNLDIINAIGAPNPVDLFNQGRWTWDAMLEIMRMATRDTTGDGTIDQWGIAAQPDNITFNLIAANDGIMVDDNLQYAFDHPNTIAALELTEIIFRESLWQYDPVQGMDTGDWGRNFWAFQEGNAALFVAATWAMNDGDLPFEFAAVPFPLGPNSTSGNVRMAGWDQALTFPHGSSWNAADILMVVEEFWAWAGDEPELMFEDGLGWPRTIFLTEDDVQRVIYVGRHAARDIGMVVPEYSWVLGAFIEYFATQEMTVLPAVESRRGPQQELLDNFFR